MLPELDKERLLHIRDAATRISESTRGLCPEVEWEVIRGLRNRLAHSCFDINLGLVWYSATEDTPRLLSAIQALLLRG
jgi:uncharacterized protein with HEPN domain